MLDPTAHVATCVSPVKVVCERTIRKRTIKEFPYNKRRVSMINVSLGERVPYRQRSYCSPRPLLVDQRNGSVIETGDGAYRMCGTPVHGAPVPENIASATQPVKLSPERRIVEHRSKRTRKRSTYVADFVA